METENIEKYDIGDNENIKIKNGKSAQEVDCNDEKEIKDVKEAAAAAAVNIRDKMIKYRINISNFKSIIKQQKQLQQATFCVSSSYYAHTINTTTFITIITKNTFTTTNNSSSTTRTTIDNTTNFINLLNVYKENLILVVLSASASVNIRNTTPQLPQEPPKIILLLLIDKIIQELFNNNTKTKKNIINNISNSIPNTNAFLKIFEIQNGKRTQEIDRLYCYAENNISIKDITWKKENQKIIFKDLRLPFAILLSPQLLTPLLEEANEPLPKFLCMSPFNKTRNTICNAILDVVIVLKFVIVIILIRIIDFFFNFVNYYYSVLFSKILLLFLYMFITNTQTTAKTLNTFPLKFTSLYKLFDNHCDNNNNDHIIVANNFYISVKCFVFKKIFLWLSLSKFFFFNDSRWKCFNDTISNFL